MSRFQAEAPESDKTWSYVTCMIKRLYFMRSGFIVFFVMSQIKSAICKLALLNIAGIWNLMTQSWNSKFELGLSCDVSLSSVNVWPCDCHCDCSTQPAILQYNICHICHILTWQTNGELNCRRFLHSLMRILNLKHLLCTFTVYFNPFCMQTIPFDRKPPELYTCATSLNLGESICNCF